MWMVNIDAQRGGGPSLWTPPYSTSAPAHADLELLAQGGRASGPWRSPDTAERPAWKRQAGALGTVRLVYDVSTNAAVRPAGPDGRPAANQ